VHSGVAQGCPLSPFLYAVLNDGLLDLKGATDVCRQFDEALSKCGGVSYRVGARLREAVMKLLPCVSGGALGRGERVQLGGHNREDPGRLGCGGKNAVT
jgi:hypothetical protein